MDKVFDELSISLATSDQMRSWPLVKLKNQKQLITEL